MTFPDPPDTLHVVSRFARTAPVAGHAHGFHRQEHGEGLAHLAEDAHAEARERVAVEHVEGRRELEAEQCCCRHEWRPT
jgi:hypothetical protein